MPTAAATAPPPTAVRRDAVAARLDEVRQRTLDLLGVVDWETLRRQHIPILSPMIWDLGHIANFEEQWIGQRLAGEPPQVPGLQRMFDPVANPRPTRAALPLPSGDELLGYLRQVREQTLRVLDSGADGGDPRLVQDGYVFEMVAEHEEQHQETLLQCLQILDSPPYTPPRRRPLPVGPPLSPATLAGGGRDANGDTPHTAPGSTGMAGGGMVEIPAGPFRMGWQAGGFAYDNELPAHEVYVPTFRIDRLPVSNARYLEFVSDGGYQRPELWNEAGWAFRLQDGMEAPRHWRREGETWLVRHMDRTQPVGELLDRPVIHVCYWEADAFARWAGLRLPTEPEWEKAALWDAHVGAARPWPWGDTPPDPSAPNAAHANHEAEPTARTNVDEKRQFLRSLLANVDQLAFAPAPLGAYPQGRSAYGLEQLVGDMWEWTSSDFDGYPGFVAYPYDDYSKSWFGSDYKVLRGSSWATRSAVARGTFRNWDFPIRRQIFAGFRLAADAEG